ncbi:MAG TPA: hypothetical protein VHX15_07135 [Frankiaceae bacterium]|jgi:hypothetical protein|nr:hypothetical protein [Frankiaceae bacterium]
MIEAEFAVKVAQLHALAAELAAAVSSDTSGMLAVESLPRCSAPDGSWICCPVG